MERRHMKGIRLVATKHTETGMWFTLRYLDRTGRDQETPEGFLTHHELSAHVKSIEEKANAAAQAELPWY